MRFGPCRFSHQNLGTRLDPANGYVSDGRTLEGPVSNQLCVESAIARVLELLVSNQTKNYKNSKTKYLTLISSKNSPCSSGAVLFLPPDFVVTFKLTLGFFEAVDSATAVATEKPKSAPSPRRAFITKSGIETSPRKQLTAGPPPQRRENQFI